MNLMNLKYTKQNKSLTKDEVGIPTSCSLGISNKVWGSSTKELFNDLNIFGESIGSVGTCFYIPQLKILFDSGIKFKSQIIENIFISHGHVDHCSALLYNILHQKSTTVIYVPKKSKILFENMLNTSYSLNKGFIATLPNKIIGVEGGDIIKLKNGYEIEVYDLTHDVPTNGYGLIRRIKKIKSEYIDFIKDKSNEILKSGKQIYYDKLDYKFIFLTDTDKTILTNDYIYKYKYIMIECTFYTSVKNIKSKHISWSDIKPYVSNHLNNIFILIHFSDRYNPTDTHSFFQKENLSNLLV